MKVQSPQDANDLMFQVIQQQQRNEQKRADRRQSQTATSSSDSDTHDDSENDGGGFSSCMRSKCLFRILIAIILVGVVLGILTAMGILEKSSVDFGEFFDSDPFGGDVDVNDPSSAFRWPNTNQQGLELTVLNALTEEWQGEFDRAVSEWENGQPDTLTLIVDRVTVDPACEAISGVMKVCNDDYGNTDWRGLNTVLLDLEGRWIYSSTAKMNDRFLSRAALRQYTMCHEIGHGFGLPHWDENFYNLNLGNCMDYTNRPRSNQSPGQSNFEFLEQLYGRIDGGGDTNSGTVGSGTVPFSPSLPPQDNEKEEEDEDDRRRKLVRYHLRGRSKDTAASQTIVPNFIMKEYHRIGRVEDVAQEDQRHRVLESSRSEDGDQYTLIDLGYQNYGVLIYKLAALPEADPLEDDGDD